MPYIPGIMAATLDVVTPGTGVLSITAAGSNYTNNSTTSSVTYPSISPPADAVVYVLFGWRGGSSLRTNNVPTAGFNTTGAFTEVINTGLAAGDGTSNTLRAAIYKATTTGTPGSGTIVCTTSGSTYQQIVSVLYVENDTGNERTLTFNGTDVTGSGSWSSTPSGHRASIGIIVQNGTSGTLAFDDELSSVGLAPFDIGQMSAHVGEHLGTISDPQGFSGGHSGRRKIFVGASVTGPSS